MEIQKLSNQLKFCSQEHTDIFKDRNIYPVKKILSVCG